MTSFQLRVESEYFSSQILQNRNKKEIVLQRKLVNLIYTYLNEVCLTLWAVLALTLAESQWSMVHFWRDSERR